MKIKNKLLSFIILLFFSIPLNVFAYSNYIIPGGETIGIEVNSKGVLVVGFYKVNNSYIGRNAGFEVGDRIIKLVFIGQDLDKENIKKELDKILD